MYIVVPTFHIFIGGCSLGGVFPSDTSAMIRALVFDKHSEQKAVFPMRRIPDFQRWLRGLDPHTLKCVARCAMIAASLSALSAVNAHASTITHDTALLFIPLQTWFDSAGDFMSTTVARVGSLAAIVLCGIGYAHGEGATKKMLGGTAIGVGIAGGALNFYNWITT